MSGFTVAAESERLVLRALTSGDADEVVAITDDPTVTDVVSFLSSPFTKADAQRLIARNENGRDCFLGVRLRSDRALLGVVGAHLVGGDAVEIGYWLAPARHGRGFATEAVRGVVAVVRDLLPDREIFAECRPENLPSLRVLTKAGFREAGMDGERPGRRKLVLPMSRLP